MRPRGATMIRLAGIGLILSSRRDNPPEANAGGRDAPSDELLGHASQNTTPAGRSCRAGLRPAEIGVLVSASATEPGTTGYGLRATIDHPDMQGRFDGE